MKRRPLLILDGPPFSDRVDWTIERLAPTRKMRSENARGITF
jgi:hypothetical protein